MQRLLLVFVEASSRFATQPVLADHLFEKRRRAIPFLAGHLKEGLQGVVDHIHAGHIHDLHGPHGMVGAQLEPQIYVLRYRIAFVDLIRRLVVKEAEKTVDDEPRDMSRKDRGLADGPAKFQNPIDNRSFRLVSPDHLHESYDRDGAEEVGLNNAFGIGRSGFPDVFPLGLRFLGDDAFFKGKLIRADLCLDETLGVGAPKIGEENSTRRPFNQRGAIVIAPLSMCVITFFSS